MSPRSLRAVVLLNCLVPGLLLCGYAARGLLGANPVEFLLRATGTVALCFLLLSLAVTPLRRLCRWPVVGKFRRMLGLSAFFYGVVHFTIYLVLDQGLSLLGVAQDVFGRPFVTAGFLALFLMVPLAATSTAGWIRRLGAARWQRLHRRVYAIGLLAVVHYLWLVRADHRGPLLAGGVLLALLLVRVGYGLHGIRGTPSR